MDPIEAPGGSRGTPGATTAPRAMLIREEPNDPVSPDFRPGLFVKDSARPGGPGKHQRPAVAKKKSHDAMFFMNTDYKFFSGRFGLGAASIFFLSSGRAPGTPPSPPLPIFGLLTPVCRSTQV